MSGPDLMRFKEKLHAHAWFILINALLLVLISCRYFTFLPEFPTDVLTLTFLLVSALSQMTLLAAVVGLVALPVLFLPKPLRNSCQALVASLGVVILIIDTLVFAQYRFHINSVVLDLVLSGQIVSFPLISWITVITLVIVLLLVQWRVIRWLENGPKIRKIKLGRKFALLSVIALLLSNVIHIWAAAHAYQPVSIVKRYLPLFYPTTANRFMQKSGWVDQVALARQKALSLTRKKDLHYPLSPLKTNPPEKPVNIVFLVVDSWRFDSFSQSNTPNMWEYAQKGVILNNHMATGNSTQAGIFGLFYGMPGTYWHGFLANQQSPLFIDRLQALDYQLGIFAAAKLSKPEFHRTVFSNIDDLRMGSKGWRPHERDADLTQDWLDWNDNRDQSKPAFSFLFYDAPHGYDFPNDFQPRFEPMLGRINYLELNNESDSIPFLNRYKTSVRYVDSLAEKVLSRLKETGELDNTLLVITGDHGQEANDNKLNFWGHNSNFTNVQVNVPFAIIGPGINAQTVKQVNGMLTSHQDIVPTLMKHYLGVQNNTRDYSVGVDLLGEEAPREWVISSSYNEYAIITDHTILEVSASGQYQLLDKTNRKIKNQDPNFDYLKEALEQMSRFNR